MMMKFLSLISPLDYMTSRKVMSCPKLRALKSNAGLEPKTQFFLRLLRKVFRMTLV